MTKKADRARRCDVWVYPNYKFQAILQISDVKGEMSVGYINISILFTKDEKLGKGGEKGKSN